MKKYIHFLLIFITFPQIHVQRETCIKLSNKTVQNRVNSYLIHQKINIILDRTYGN